MIDRVEVKTEVTEETELEEKPSMSLDQRLREMTGEPQESASHVEVLVKHEHKDIEIKQERGRSPSGSAIDMEISDPESDNEKKIKPENFQVPPGNFHKQNPPQHMWEGHHPNWTEFGPR